jgi:hypothetical protein
MIIWGFFTPALGGGGLHYLRFPFKSWQLFFVDHFSAFYLQKNLYFPGGNQMYFSAVYGLPIAVFIFYKIRDQIRPTCAWLFLNSHLVFPLIFRVPNIVIIYLLYCIGTIHTYYPPVLAICSPLSYEHCVNNNTYLKPQLE